MSKAPEVCLYCKGSGLAAGGNCGFCVEGKPLDTQEDWDASWGGIHEKAVKFAEELMRKRNA